ncbi:hypothetical protein LCGC14_2064740, partial [marine sediment metagenome]
PQTEGDLANFFAETEKRVTELKSFAVQQAADTRDFILHNYGKRIGADLIAGYIWPYQFWQSRTYAKWMKRFAQHPSLLANYMIYRRGMERQHPNLPNWWKYSINTNELLGLDSEHPLWFNLEGAANPLSGLVATDFNDPRRRVDFMSGVIDDLNKFGPSVWMPYQVAMAVKHHINGKEDAARRWFGRFWSPSRYIRDITALMDKEGLGTEIDPFINIFSGGIGPYEEARVGRQLTAMVGEGKYTEADIMDAAFAHEGPIWDEAHARAINQAAPNVLQAAPFMFGTRFKLRTPADMEIDRFYNRMFNLIDMKSDMSPEEYRDNWAQLEEEYPFMDILLLSKKGGFDRDEALAWNVIDRIPPGQSRDFAKLANIPETALDDFFNSKGDLEGMSEADRMQFMGGIIRLSALLDIPDRATRGEWDLVSSLQSEMRKLGEQFFGEDIWPIVEKVYREMGKSQAHTDKSDYGTLLNKIADESTRPYCYTIDHSEATEDRIAYKVLDCPLTNRLKEWGMEKFGLHVTVPWHEGYAEAFGYRFNMPSYVLGGDDCTEHLWEKA